MGVTFLSKMVSKRVRSGTSERAASLINTLLSNLGYLGKKQVRFRFRSCTAKTITTKGSAVEKKPLDKLSSLLSTMPIRIKSV